MLRWYEYIKKIKQAQFLRKQRAQLDVLLSQARPEAPLEERLLWLARFLQWLRFESALDTQQELQPHRLPVARLRFLLRILDRNEKWKSTLARTLRYTLRDVRATELFSETGLPTEYGLLGELTERVLIKLLPSRPFNNLLSDSFSQLFPFDSDARWVEAIDESTFSKLVQLINFDEHPYEPEWDAFSSEMREALIYLVTQIAAIGLSPGIRSRLGVQPLRGLPFFSLTTVTNDFLDALKSKDPVLVSACSHHLLERLDQSEKLRKDVLVHLNEYGVSTGIVYQLEKLKRYTRRSRILVQILASRNLDSGLITQFAANLIEENLSRLRVRDLLRQSLSLLAQKVVDRNVKTGDHYITRTREQFFDLFQRALGGGAITSFTVYVKIFIGSIGLPQFLTGVLAGTNYALSFVIIQLSGCTLGTKQAAATAPALASQMDNLQKRANLEALLDEIVNLIRSQFSSILGNVLAVFPTAFVVNALFTYLGKSSLVSKAKAIKLVSDLDVFGPSFIFASFTGVLLWLSSLIAGWIDNFFVYHRLGLALSRHITLTMAFGEEGAKKISDFFAQNIAGLAGSISLGFLLGLMPHLMQSLDIPLDIRHVTLAAGNLASTLPVLGISSVGTFEFWRAACGIALIGIANVGVSFYLAFVIAIRAKSLKAFERKQIYAGLWRRFIKRPFDFFLPPKSASTR